MGMVTLVGVKQIFEIKGKLYTMEYPKGPLTVGMTIFDSRMRDFLILENESDCFKYEFVAPELYRVLQEYKF
jgi:hypothetical protein